MTEYSILATSPLCSELADFLDASLVHQLSLDGILRQVSASEAVNPSHFESRLQTIYDWLYSWSGTLGIDLERAAKLKQQLEGPCSGPNLLSLLQIAQSNEAQRAEKIAELKEMQEMAATLERMLEIVGDKIELLTAELRLPSEKLSPSSSRDGEDATRLSRAKTSLSPTADEQEANRLRLLVTKQGATGFLPQTKNISKEIEFLETRIHQFDRPVASLLSPDILAGFKSLMSIFDTQFVPIVHSKLKQLETLSDQAGSMKQHMNQICGILLKQNLDQIQPSPEPSDADQQIIQALSPFFTIYLNTGSKHQDPEGIIAKYYQLQSWFKRRKKMITYLFIYWIKIIHYLIIIWFYLFIYWSIESDTKKYIDPIEFDRE